MCNGFAVNLEILHSCQPLKYKMATKFSMYRIKLDTNKLSFLVSF